MKLSVIIVNYNVELYLQQCLLSVFRSKNIDFEVFVVDNNSGDRSCQMVRENFPQVKLIENKYNPGFSVANNQALELATGEYALLLNPDTVVAEDTFENTCRFMDEHPDAGGLGVKMLDGYGCFLPESKRGFPSPFASFSKIFGLSSLFPNSRFFGKYHLRYLDENETHNVDILAGAFMLMRAETLKKTGFLDETFFMYGEDIDLSYRITLAGYKNYYLPQRIMHYKGESTHRDSLKYVRVFYESMIIFFKKHFHKSSFVLGLFIKLAIFIRAGLSSVKRVLKRVLPSPKAPESNALLLGNTAHIASCFDHAKSLGKETGKDAINEFIKTHRINSIVLSVQDFSYKDIITYIESIKGCCELFIYHPHEKLLVSAGKSLKVG